MFNRDAASINELLVGAATFTRPLGAATSTSTVTVSRHELDPQSGYWNVFSNLKRSYKYAYGSMAKAEQQLSWKLGPDGTVTTGGTFERFFAIPQGADLNAPIGSRDEPGTILDTNIADEFVKVRYSNSGAFGQLQYGATDAIALTLGARFDYNSRYGSTFNPRAGVVVTPSRGTTLKLLFGSAYLAPSPYQSYGHYGSFYSTDGGQTFASDYWHLPNPDLEPQRKKTVEVNLQQSLGASTQLTASGFFSRFTNLLQGADPDRAYAGFYKGWPVDYIDFPVNEGDGSGYGGSVGVDYLRAFDAERQLRAHAALAFADGRVREQDDIDQALPIGGMVPLQLRFGADVDWDRWSVAPRLALVGTQRLLAMTDDNRRRTLDGYATVDVNLRRRAVLKNLDLFLTVENAFDRRYRNINVRAYTNPEELIGSPQNPRRITVGFDVQVKPGS